MPLLVTIPPSVVTVTGTILNAAEQPVAGKVIFTPSTGLFNPDGSPETVPVTDPAGEVVIAMTAASEDLDANGQFSTGLIPTDAPGLSPEGWTYQVTIYIPGLPDYGFACFIPSTPDPVDLSQLVPVTAVAEVGTYLPTTGGTLSGLLILGNGLRIPAGAVAGYVLTSDANGNGSWQAAPEDKNFTLPFTGLATVTVPHNLGKYPAVTVMDSAGDECEGDVVYAGPNSLTVSFSAPFDGTVTCN